MATEIIDYLLVFWCLLAIVVYIGGNIYDSQLQERKKKQAQRDRRKYSSAATEAGPGGYRAYNGSTNLDDFWSTGASADVQRRSSALQHSAGPSSWAHGPDNSSFYQQQPYSSAGAYNQFDVAGHTQASYGASGYAPAMDHHHQQQQQARNRFDSYTATTYGPTGGYVETRQDLTNLESPSSTSATTIPTATGFNADCVEWVNGILYLFYTQPEKYGPIISENVYRSLNEKLSNMTVNNSSGLSIEFTGVNAHDCTRPDLTNIRTESESDKSISASCKIYNRRLNFNLSLRPLPGARSEDSTTHDQYGAHHYLHDDTEQVKQYELILENLEGKLKSMAMLNEKLIVIQFIEKPDTKILLRPVSASTQATPSRLQQLINEDLLVQLILQAITQVVVDLYFGDDVDFPQYKHNHSSLSASYSNYKHKLNSMIRGSANELKRQLGALSPSSLSDHLGGNHKERKVFVKVVRASNINYNQNVTCLMELDQPKQQAVSSKRQGSDPYWDEHFLFNVNEKSGELTLELWDSINAAALLTLNENQRQAQIVDGTSSLKRGQTNKQSANKWNKADLTAGAKFLGVARISIEELRRNPVQKVSVALQPVGAVTDLSNSVGGELQLELLFMEHSAQAAAASAGGTLGTPPTAQTGNGALYKSNSLSSLAYQQGDIVSIDRKLTPSGYVITTTTITKQPGPTKQQQQQQTLLQPRSQSPVGSTSVATEHSFDEMINFDGISSSQMSATAAHTNTNTNQHLDRRSEGTGAGSSTGGRPLSRSRSRSRSFLRAIRKRLSFSRTRSRSVGESHGAGLDGNQSPTVTDYDGRHSRASSEVSVGGLGEGGRAKSVPASRDPNEVPTIVINKGRLSDTASAFTFNHPKSQLVYEVMEPSLHDGSNPADGPRSSAVRYRYYAVPDDSASQRKWRKRGLKMHVFNEHQFIACHLAGSSTCHLCGRVFSRRPGKQGYKCRNCHLLSHKQCHIKVDHNCPYAKRDGLRLEYIDADPPSSLVDELMLSNEYPSSGNNSPDLAGTATNQYQQTQQQRPSQKSRGGRAALRKGAKSISVEVDDR